ncbi:sensor histidine kinase [Pedobacter sp. AW31-3R]|uniref:sensor histidine kinase n=1 Tax=Pedobacter sp. AW31-3R TaxID=3445781 RepID=UPI003FA00A55
MKDNSEQKNTTLQNFIVHEQYRLLRHGVLLFFSLVIIFYSNWQYEYSGQYKFYRLLCVFTGLVTMCYVNMFILVPLFFFTRKYVLYFATLSLLVIAFQSLLSTLLRRFFHASVTVIDHAGYDHADAGSYEGFIILLPIILLTTMIKLFQRWIRDNHRIAELQNNSLRMELNELRNQINPHFLFNMLNGIKALIRTDPEKAVTVIMTLSEFLRYQIYENNEEKTPLKSEIAFLSNFLSLEMLRRDHLSTEIITPETPGILNNIYIPANLFTTFVENAVKHSADISNSGSHISIKLEIVENQLHFYCTNSKDIYYVSSDQKNSGLGLANIKRRLTLLYEEAHSLEVLSTRDQFSITLKIPI